MGKDNKERIAFLYINEKCPMIYYINNESRYIDFNTIKEQTKRSRTFLNQVLDKVEVRKIYYKNRLLFNLDDVLKSNELNRYFQ